MGLSSILSNASGTMFAAGMLEAFVFLIKPPLVADVWCFSMETLTGCPAQPTLGSAPKWEGMTVVSDRPLCHDGARPPPRSHQHSATPSRSWKIHLQQGTWYRAGGKQADPSWDCRQVGSRGLGCAKESGGSGQCSTVCAASLLCLPLHTSSASSMPPTLTCLSRLAPNAH